MTVNIRKSILSALKWNAIGQLGRQFISFFVSVLLTRILLPEEFGLIGILLFFTSIADVFISSGLGVALVQKKEKTDIDYSTVFFFNVLISVLFYVLLFFLAPLISGFYNEPKLTILTRVISLVFVINAIGTVQMVILTIELDFKKQNIISLFGVIVSAIISIYMAYNNYGVYSLVGQTLSYSISTNTMYWYYTKWRPKLLFSKIAFKSLFDFGFKIFISSILDKIFTTIDNLLIGKIFNPAQLGFYMRAKSNKDLPIANTTSILSSAFFPVFSKCSDEELVEMHLKVFRLVAFFINPLMAGLFVLAQPFTLLLFGVKWIESVPMLKIFCIYGPIYPLSVILVQTILIKGKSNKFLKLDIYKKAVLVSAMIIGVYIGVISFLIAVCIANYIAFYLNLLFTSNIMNVKVSEYFKGLWPSFIISIVMALFIFIFDFIKIEILLVKFILECVIGLFIYTILSKFFNPKDYFHTLEIIKNRKL